MGTQKYRVEERKGSAHGGLYIFEQTTYFDVVNDSTNTVVMTFEGEYYGEMNGSNGMKDEEHSGVEKVVLSKDGHGVLVYTFDVITPQTISLPD